MQVICVRSWWAPGQFHCQANSLIRWATATGQFTKPTDGNQRWKKDPINSDPKTRDSEYSGGEDNNEYLHNDHTPMVFIERNGNYLTNQPRKFLVWIFCYLHITFISQSSTAKQMEFNTTELVKKKEGTFTVPAVITDYLKKRMNWCHTKGQCEALIKDHPKPDSPSCKVLAVGKFLKELLNFWTSELFLLKHSMKRQS